MRKRLSMLVGALVAAQLLSGCYMLRGFDWSKDLLGKGDKATAELQLAGLSGDPVEPGRFFLMAPRGEEISYEGAKFDTKEALGGTQRLRRDPSLAAVASEDASCTPELPPGRRGDGGSIVLYRTKDIQPETQKLVQATVKVEASDNNASGGIFGSFQTGAWIDDGDGVPEDPGTSDDVVGCFGIATTLLGKKGNDR